jgi:hypothetical protein
MRASEVRSTGATPPSLVTYKENVMADSEHRVLDVPLMSFAIEQEFAKLKASDQWRRESRTEGASRRGADNGRRDGGRFMSEHAHTSIDGSRVAGANTALKMHKYQAMARANFETWRLEVGGLVENPPVLRDGRRGCHADRSTPSTPLRRRRVLAGDLSRPLALKKISKI